MLAQHLMAVASKFNEILYPKTPEAHETISNVSPSQTSGAGAFAHLRDLNLLHMFVHEGSHADHSPQAPRVARYIYK